MAEATATKSIQEKGNPQGVKRWKERPAEFAPTGLASDVLALHDVAGNRAVTHLLRSNLQSFGLPPSSLRLSQPGEAREQEADQMAEQVTRPLGAQKQLRISANQPGKAFYQRFPLNHGARPGGQPPPPALRATFESRFGYDLGHVRLHTGLQAARMAQTLNANAFTTGADIVFDEGVFIPGTRAGDLLLAHELAHIIQQSRYGAMPAGLVQRQQASRESLQRQLHEKEAELARLRRRADELQDQFVTARIGAVSRESKQRSVAQARAAARSETGTSPVSATALDMLNRAIRVQQSGTTIRLTVTMQITFLGLSEERGRDRAQSEIPRIANAIREGWTIQFSQGARRGQTFTLDPQITYRPPTKARDRNAWQIEVRARDDGKGSTGSWWNGIISLSPVHLQGERVRTLAHEVYHLFGFTDAYLTMTTGRGPSLRTRGAVGREDPAGRPDLLGLTDPVVLRRWLRQGIITQEQFNRQTQSTARVWEEDAEEILRALVVPTPQERQLEQSARQARQTRSAKLTLNSVQWLETVENITRLEQEITNLQRQLGSAPVPARGQRQ